MGNNNQYYGDAIDEDVNENRPETNDPKGGFVHELILEYIKLYEQNGRNLDKVSEITGDSKAGIKNLLEDSEYLMERYGIDFKL